MTAVPSAVVKGRRVARALLWLAGLVTVALLILLLVVAI